MNNEILFNRRSILKKSWILNPKKRHYFNNSGVHNKNNKN